MWVDLLGREGEWGGGVGGFKGGSLRRMWVGGGRWIL